MNFETLTIKALDGYNLSGRRYSGQETSRRIVLAGATGVPQGFYRYFAEAAVSRGFEVITFDYRGIGESAPKSLRGFEMNYLDWAQLDLAGVLHELGSDKGIHLVGHSFGGQTLGVLPDLTRVISLHTFATGAGWHGWMPKGEQIRVKILWNIAGPIVTRSKGYLAWKKLGLGEDLPIGVYRQWKYWCKFPNYWFDDPKLNNQMRDSFARVRVPVTALNAIDDRWATPQSRDAFMNYYVNAELKLIDIDPREFNLKAIGHMGYFRRGSEELWSRVFEDLEKLNAQRIPLYSSAEFQRKYLTLLQNDQVQIDEIVDDLLNRFDHLVVMKTWGETSLFFNPNGASAHGSYFVTMKDSDGENDKASNLDRDGIFRISFGISINSYEALFGPKPPRPLKGGVVETGHDFTQTNLLMPHPIYAWMNWLQVLNPSQETWNSNQNLIQESYGLSKARFEKR